MQHSCRIERDRVQISGLEAKVQALEAQNMDISPLDNFVESGEFWENSG